MEQLVDFGFDLFNSVQPLVKFFSTEIEFVVVELTPSGTFEGLSTFTTTPSLLITGGGLVVFLVAKIYKFILDLIPLV